MKWRDLKENLEAMDEEDLEKEVLVKGRDGFLEEVYCLENPPESYGFRLILNRND